MSGLVAAVFVGALVLAGCGGGGSKANASAASSTSTTAANGRDTAALQKYRDCLKEHGVDLPANFGGGGGGAGRQGAQGAQGAPPATDSTGSTIPRNRGTLPPGVDQQTFQAAQQACESLRPAGGGFGGGQGGGRNSTEFRAYVSCLADHGVPVSTTTSTSTPPSTTAGGGGGGQRPGQQFDRNDPHFAAANQVCMALLPQPSTTTTTAAKS